METIKATFKKLMLLAYSLINAPGTYELEVASNVSEANLFTDGEGRKRYIVNLKAIASDKFEQLKAAFGTANEIPLEQTNGLFLTGSIWKPENKEAALPMKGEKVKVTIGYVKDREQNDVLRVTNVQVAAAIVAPKLNIAEFFGVPAAPAAPVEQGSTLQHA